jgi:hypothetical protein
VHIFGVIRHSPVVAPVALVHGPKADAGEFFLLGELQGPTGEVAERQAADQLAF